MNNEINTNCPAFPSKLTGPCEAYGLKADATQVLEFPGMTLRDYFAAKAMQASLTVIREFPDEHWRMGLALDSYAMADAMLKARQA